MSKFRKKPIVVEAVQWFKNGDHPEDKCAFIQPSEGDKEAFMSEGKIVRYFRRPDIMAGRACQHCRIRMREHGWVDTLEAGHTVCPGDWIITGVKGEHYPYKPDIFEETYEKCAEQPLNDLSHLTKEPLVSSKSKTTST